ncbi:T9SS type A sorting domain-containing protein [Hymenobacter sp. GOD-10R]|uniref:T9SS type A sorting domain-containing protein n=1 Tax=Hymenobacter sp. GOD-10R TaxID=3093922 RepID=UPI002D77D8FB|nr:T9SS type A sorting domain-containing protein [Hymenobacter sp. GOD-10R]WRQ29024.1 T9SS type A sorting domain-containing protein [Hymenobacter sp. GOD-10R]
MLPRTCKRQLASRKPFIQPTQTPYTMLRTATLISRFIRFTKPLLAGSVLGMLGLCAPIQAQRLIAFPGAEGAGKYTSGGRGTPAVATTVYEVTNLNDDTSPGSLRYAVTQNSSVLYRTVVFRVSGTIHLLSPLSFNRANTTVAGQTAPGDGICLADYPVSVGANNVIVRYIRFRMGDKNQNKGMVDGSGSDDAFGALSRTSLIVDHCTMSWSSDEACTVYRGDSTTLQWNIISEPLNYSYHFETGDTDFERHGYGGIWGGRHASFHHNLLAHCLGRVPRFDGSRNLAPNTAGQENADFRNNVLYNWGSYNTNGGEGGNYNIVNNYYKYGPSTSTGSSGGVSIRSEVLNPYKQNSSPVLPYGKYYLTGNYVDGSPTVTKQNWLGVVMNGGTRADTVLSKVATPFTVLDFPTQSATEAYEAVLQGAGATLPKRDPLDQRIVQDVRNRTGAIIDVQGGFPHGTPYAQTVGAWPVLNSAPAPTDTDHDGMPDAWELSQQLNPNDPSDRNVRGTNGYTMLENYLNTIGSVVTGVAVQTTQIGALVAYPNPAREQLTVAHPVAVRGAKVLVYSFEGKKVAEFASDLGTQQTSVSLQGLAHGNYLLVYTGGAARLTTKVIKQ